MVYYTPIHAPPTRARIPIARALLLLRSFPPQLEQNECSVSA